MTGGRFQLQQFSAVGSTHLARKRQLQKFLLTATFMFVLSSPTNGGEIADSLGIYLPSNGGECAKGEQKAMGVCIPIATMIGANADMLHLGITELTRPEDLPGLKAYMQRKYMENIPVLEVEINSYHNPIFKLVDGSILEKTSSGYVGHIGYHEDAVLYQKGTQWMLCVNGAVHNVDFLKDTGSHYSRSSLSMTLAQIEERKECD